MAKLSKKQQIRKKFFPVEIPSLRKQVELYGKNLEELNNTNIKINLANELHGKGVDIKLKVKADKEKATASPIELKLLSSYIKRIVRKGTDYAEDSFITECKDNKIKIKFIAITRKRVTRKILSAIAKESKKQLQESVKNMTFEELINEIISNKFQKHIMTKLKKIYPLNTFEVKQIQLYTKEEYQETSKIAKKKLAEEQKTEEQEKSEQNKKTNNKEQEETKQEKSEQIKEEEKINENQTE